MKAISIAGEIRFKAEVAFDGQEIARSYLRKVDSPLLMQVVSIIFCIRLKFLNIYTNIQIISVPTHIVYDLTDIYFVFNCIIKSACNDISIIDKNYTPSNVVLVGVGVKLESPCLSLSLCLSVCQ